MKIRFADNEPVEVEPGVSLAAAADIAGAEYTHTCRGHGRCGMCIATIENGIENLTPPNEAEARVLRILNTAPNQRLACRTILNGDVECGFYSNSTTKC
ncbi:MAG: (2Fe-2S)-binding protein [Holophagales bacterium]|jgi:adenylate cyclase|nr:(2Fe-2S)-binding protein [Holophagales bacterium]